jgi:hypothetical protein
MACTYRCELPGVTLAYPKGKGAESEEAQEHANSSGLALHVSSSVGEN